MKYPILLAMSLLSLLFGCRDKKKTEAARPWPPFPESDQPALRIEAITLDSGYAMQAFFIPENKQEVFVLAFRRTVAHPRNRYEEEKADGRIFSLDLQGKVQKSLTIKHTEWIPNASFGMLDGRLMVLLWQKFLVLDPEKFAVLAEIPVYDEDFFPSKLPIEEMTFDERRDNYTAALATALDHCKQGRWLDWTPGGSYFVLAEDAKGKSAAWAPYTYRDEDIDPLKARFPAIGVELAQQPEGFVNDEGASLHEVEYLPGGTQLDYPNYKSRLIQQYELTLGEKKARFSTTDRDRHALNLAYADNLKLTSADGAAWVSYEGVLYRMR